MLNGCPAANDNNRQTKSLVRFMDPAEDSRPSLDIDVMKDTEPKTASCRIPNYCIRRMTLRDRFVQLQV